MGELFGHQVPDTLFGMDAHGGADPGSWKGSRYEVGLHGRVGGPLLYCHQPGGNGISLGLVYSPLLGSVYVRGRSLRWAPTEGRGHRWPACRCVRPVPLTSDPGEGLVALG